MKLQSKHSDEIDIIQMGYMILLHLYIFREFEYMFIKWIYDIIFENLKESRTIFKSSFESNLTIINK